jgi:hypothetical protein
MTGDFVERVEFDDLYYPSVVCCGHNYMSYAKFQAGQSIDAASGRSC